MCKLLITLAFGQGSGQRHTTRARAIATLMFCCAVAFHANSFAQSCGLPGNDGIGSVSGVINTYWPGTSNPGAGTTTLSLGTATGAGTAIASGDLLLVIQMQDANINRNNSGAYGDGAGGDPATGTTNLRRTGRFEFARATNSVGLGGGTLTLADATIFNYATQAATGTRGQRVFQVIRVPQFSDLTLAGTLIAPDWNGTTGGVVAVDVANTLDWNGQDIDVSGAGFRGGGARASTIGSGANTDYRTVFSNGANGAKGEGIAGTPRLVITGNTVLDNLIEGYPNGSFARGAPGNAGGGGTDGQPSINDQNTGGGGGGGYGDGGRGGHAWCPGGPSVCPQSGGFGGDGMTAQHVDRLMLGGGGGAGTTNNATGTPANGVASSGATGGGLIIVRADTITGSGRALADGMTGNQTVDNDGSGGGGGAGSVLVVAQDAGTASLNLLARGGDGGSNGNSSPHGPGGGGGGGLIALNSALSGAGSQIQGGIPGTTQGNPAPFTVNYGATAGASGARITINELSIPGVPSGADCLEPLVVTKTALVISDPVDGSSNAHALPGAIVEYTINVSNPGPVALDGGSVEFSDLIPSGTDFINSALSGGLSVALSNGGPASGLTLSAAGLTFSDDGGATFAYTPAAGIDANVDALRVRPGGAMAAGSNVNIRFRVVIE